LKVSNGNVRAKFNYNSNIQAGVAIPGDYVQYMVCYKDRASRLEPVLYELKHELETKGVDVQVEPYIGLIDKNKQLVPLGPTGRPGEITIDTGYRGGYSVSYVGPKDQLEYLLNKVADHNLGPPDEIEYVVSFKHPIESIKGFKAAFEISKSISDNVEMVETRNMYRADKMPYQRIVKINVKFKPK
jgi:hypothetical protein